MQGWNLPASVDVAGADFKIRTSYMVILDVLDAISNPDYDDEEKLLYVLMSIIIDFDSLPENEYMTAYEAVKDFIDMGMGENKNKPNHKLMDWEQDAQLIIPEINKQIGGGADVRNMPDMHWWTFMGYYMGIGESAFSHIVSLRYKKAKGEKLEKWERKFMQENKEVVELKRKLSEEELSYKEQLENLLK